MTCRLCLKEVDLKKNRKICKDCFNEQNLRNYYKKHKGTDITYSRMKEHRIKAYFGISLEEYNTLAEKTTDCNICQTPFSSSFDKQLDHCHESNIIRGFLCHKCNKALGLFKDDPLILEQALKYLQGYK